MVEKIKINVIDLDKTLLPYDSFRILIFKELKSVDLYIFRMTIMRMLRLYSTEDYKKKISLYLKSKYKNKMFIDFANKCYADIDPNVMELINKHTEVGTINILLSASPNFYVKHLINTLKWKGTGSFFNSNNEFIHVYSKNKMNWLAVNYSKHKFIYNFAISDSSSDDGLLSQFNSKEKWTV